MANGQGAWATWWTVGARLDTSLEKQNAIIDMLKEFPDGGWLFFGPPHTGKTVWTSALYGHNLYRFFIEHLHRKRQVKGKGQDGGMAHQSQGVA
jgi:hypothetical protein